MGLMTQSTQPTKAEQALSNSTDESSLRRTQARSEEIAAQIGEHPEYFRMLTGARPTGHLHLGHYFGTMQSWKQLQDANVDTWILVADYQVITDRDGCVSGFCRWLLTLWRWVWTLNVPLSSPTRPCRP